MDEVDNELSSVAGDSAQLTGNTAASSPAEGEGDRSGTSAPANENDEYSKASSEDQQRLDLPAAQPAQPTQGSVGGADAMTAMVMSGLMGSMSNASRGDEPGKAHSDDREK
ncbi:MAG: hypothetical protein HOQ36_12925 [Nocardia sp.]|nr:hypothetical protein [Nocardia sp.]